MNHPPTATGAYYQSNVTTTDVDLKCTFCGSLLLPVANLHHMSSPVAACWLCIRCPNPVFFDGILDSYKITCQHNNHWYDILYLSSAKVYLIYQIKTSLVIHADQGTEGYSTIRTLVKQIESEQTITPTNAKDKLLTILTFS